MSQHLWRSVERCSSPLVRDVCHIGTQEGAQTCGTHGRQGGKVDTGQHCAGGPPAGSGPQGRGITDAGNLQVRPLQAGGCGTVARAPMLLFHL